MSQELKAIETLKEFREDVNKFLNSFDKQYKKDEEYIVGKTTLSKINETIKELEEYEQNFKQKEFDYRTQCQDIISAGRVEAENMPDRLAELEKVILDYYLDKGYQVGVGKWDFKIHIETFYKNKFLIVFFSDYNLRDINDAVYVLSDNNTKEMFNRAIAHFSSRQNEVTDMNNDLPNSSN